MESRPTFIVVAVLRLDIVIRLQAIKWHTFTASNHFYFPAKPRPGWLFGPALIIECGILSSTLERSLLLDLSG